MLYAIIALAIIAGSAIVGLTVAYFLRAKRSEEAKPVANIASAAAPVPIEEEVKTIGEQIEKAMADQRLQGETQRQLLAQKLDTVRQSVETQKNQVEGLRSEFRHESQRRDQEISEIRSQIGSIQQTVGLTAGAQGAQQALPPAAPPQDEPAAEAPTPPPTAAPLEELTFPLPPPDEAPAEPAPSPAEEADAEPAAFEPVSFETEPDAFAPDAPDEAPFEEVTFATATPEPEPEPDAGSTFEDAAFEEATFEDATFEEATFADATFEDVEVDAEDAPADDTTFEDAAFEETTFAEEAFPTDAGGDTFAEATFADIEPPASVRGADDAADDPFATAPLYDEPAGGDSAGDVFETWSPDAADDEAAWVARPSARDVPQPVMASPDDFVTIPSTGAKAPGTPPAEGLVDLDASGSPVPEDADDLTVISTIDEDVQRRLYEAGVTTLDEIAEWGRSDARRIAAEVQVSEDTVMNQWIIEAQGALFQKFSK